MVEKKLITEEEWEWGASRNCWIDLEVAPSNDWPGPVCNDKSSSDNKCSGMVYFKDKKQMFYPECEKCPYRKMED